MTTFYVYLIFASTAKEEYVDMMLWSGAALVSVMTLETT